ncbi:MAG: cob(I)yrinic acid a,c-diamide adenosyltransferase [Lachnospiraceae bacterium]|nr:cob(I)yrinic acid a,c-diamide adenosyltransferase [Lachnospiraceae bacterium]
MGKISVFAGTGHGKTPAAFGEALMRASMGDQVVVIQYLKGKINLDSDFLSRLEPDIKIFSFEKSEDSFSDLDSIAKVEEIQNIRNGLNFAKKVLTTGGCDLLVLDEILGIVDNGILSIDELKEMLNSREEQMDVIMTGITLNDEIRELADYVSTVS